MRELTVNPRTKWILVCAVFMAAIAARIGYGFAKTDYHVDEAITLGLTNGTWLPPVNTGVYGKWMDKQELEDRAFNDSIRQKGHVDFSGLSESTALDVHPPLYYWLFAGARLIAGPRNHMAANLLLNLACFALSSIFLLVILRRVTDDSTLTVLTFALFALSSAAVSESIFLRMYELLQADCMAFLCCATILMYPRTSRPSAAERGFAYAGLLLSSCAGLLTHYYFLLFIAPVALVAVVILVRRKDFPAILWALLAVLAGLYVAYRAFPAMKDHLTGSQRARQSVGNLMRGDTSTRIGSMVSYAWLLLRYVPAFFAFILALAVRSYSRKKARRGIAPGVTVRVPFGFIALLAATFVFLFAFVSISAPYRTLRYIVSFTPAFVLLFSLSVACLLPGKPGRLVLAAALILGIMPGLLPGNIANFHEDYRIDKNLSYFADDAPVIVVSSFDGANWKNLLLYKNIPAWKKVYVSSRGSGDLSAALPPVAAKSGSRDVYVFSDDWFPRPPEFVRIGYYGFFSVYRLTVE